MTLNRVKMTLFYCCISFTCLTNKRNQRLASFEKRAHRIILRNSCAKSINNDGRVKTNIHFTTIEQFKKRQCCAVVHKSFNIFLYEDFTNYFQLFKSCWL